MKILKLLMHETFAPTSSNSQIEKHCRAIDFAYIRMCHVVVNPHPKIALCLGSVRPDLELEVLVEGLSGPWR